MADKVKILYVEDDEFLAFVTKDNLEQKGYIINHFSSGSPAIEAFSKDHYDLCILDIMLPGQDGFSIAEKIRKISEHIPILFLTARTMKEDKITGFRTGADDYITKPFSIDELCMRIEVFLKRSMVVKHERNTQSEIIGRYILDINKRELKGPESNRKLTHREVDLLRYLHKNANKRLKREEILEAIWENTDYFSGRSLDVFISRLRKYLKDDEEINLENIHGIGFCLHIPQV